VTYMVRILVYSLICCRGSFACAFLIFIGAIGGCGRLDEASHANAELPMNGPLLGSRGVLRFDLGVIQRGIEFRYCIPFSECSLSSGDEVLDVKTSCKCVVAKEVLYAASSGPDRGLLITVVPDQKESARQAPTSLDVEIVLNLKGESVRSLSVRFIETDFLGG
jgi:hypothetical protein